MDPLSFLVLEAGFILFAVLVGRAIAAQAGGTRDGVLLASALGFAALPVVLIAQVSIVAKRKRDIEPFSLLFSFQGRIPRRTFWLTQFGLLEVMVVWGLFIQVARHEMATGILLSFLLLPMILTVFGIGLAVQVKRWHDRGKSGWMVLLNFIPIVGNFWPLMELGFLRGVTGPNQFGDDPLPAT